MDQDGERDDPPGQDSDDAPDRSTMPNGSYPIERCEGENSVESAAGLAHHSDSYSFERVRAHVMRNKARLNCPDAVLPDTWQSADGDGESDASKFIRGKARGD